MDREHGLLLRKTRQVTKGIPPLLVPVYESYPDSAYFTHAHLVFFSERVAKENGTLVDFATEYLGMGHYIVHTYDSDSGKVVSCVDGGGERFTRDENAKRRQEFLTSFLSKRVQAPSPDPYSVHDSFEAWWKSRRIDTDNVVRGAGK